MIFFNRDFWNHPGRQISCNFQTPLLNWLDPTVESNWEKFSDEYFIIKLNDDIAAVVISREYILLRLLAAQLTIETNLLTVSEINGQLFTPKHRSLSAILWNLSLLVLLCLEIERTSISSANIKGQWRVCADWFKIIDCFFLWLGKGISWERIIGYSHLNGGQWKKKQDPMSTRGSFRKNAKS